MADGPTTGSENWLTRELGESRTEESRKAETLRLLAEVEEIKARFPDNPDITREYEELRNATILSLKHLQVDLRNELLGMRVELDGPGVESLSEGEIDKGEFTRIQEEFGELDEAEREASIDRLFNLLDSNNDFRYGPIINELVETDFSGIQFNELYNEFQETGKLSLKTLESLRPILLANYQIDSAMQASMYQSIEDGYANRNHINDIQAIINEYMGSQDYEIITNSEVNLLQALEQYLGNNPDATRDFILGEANIIFSGTCRGLRSLFIETIKERYYESREIAFEQSILNYYLNQGINPENLTGYEELVRTLRNGNCNIDYIASIRSFNEVNSLDITFTEEDARSIISSTIEVRESENLWALINFQNQLDTIIPELSAGEIQIAINSGNPQVIGQLLNPYRDSNPRITEIEGEIFELLDIRRDIEGQEARLSEVAGNAEEIYNMTPQEREEYRRLLMSFTGSSINIDISREVHRNYILAKPKERLILLSSAEDVMNLLQEADEIVRSSERYERLKINDINPDFLTHPGILDFFIQQESLRPQVVGSLPLHVFQDETLSQVIFGGSRFLWRALFQNIYSANTPERAINIIRAIKNNNSGEIEEHRSYFEDSIPREIYTEIIGRDMEIGNSTISSFSDNIEYIINPPAPVLSDNVISPIANGGSFPESYSPDFEPIGPDIEGTTENIMLYIRENGITEEVLVGIDRLIETRVGNGLNLVSQVLPMLNAGNQNHINFAKQAISKRQVSNENGEFREQSGAGYYRYLNVAMQSNQEIIQEMGTYGIEEFTPLLIKNISSEKLLARYLIGFQASGSHISNLRNSSNFELLRRNIDSTVISDLTVEEVGVLENFFQRRLEIEAIIDTLEGNLENINENQKRQIIEILERERIIGLDSRINGMDFSDLSQIDSLISNIGERLEAIGKTDEEIVIIIQEILDINSESGRQRVIITDREGVTSTPRMRRILEEKGFLLPGGTAENPNINFDGLVEQYLEVYRNENNLPDNLDDPEVIQAYLLSIGLTTEEANRIITNLQTRVQYEIQRRAAEEYRSRESGGTGLNNPEGLYGGTQQRMIEEISRGEFQYIPFEDSNNISIQGGTLNSRNTSQDFFNNERLSLSGENIYYTRVNGEQIPITNQEAQIIQNNPEAERNLIQTFEAFQGTGLSRLWNLRENIFRGISNVQGLSFQVNEDYINIQELKIIFDSILQSIDEAPLTSTTLGGDNGIIAEMERRNGTNINGVEAQVNMRGESKIEEKFILRYFPPGSLYFNQATFEESLKT